MKRGPLKVFYSYAHEDEKARDRIDEYLELLARQNLIVRWHDRQILPGSEWDASIVDALTSADIILLLISPAFHASKYICDYELPAAMQAHQSGKARVVPILLEKTKGWEKADYAKLQLLPTGAKPVKAWKDPVDAFADIARGVRKVAKDIIIAGGGPFEFGPHEFSEAELSRLTRAERERTAKNLEGLRNHVIGSIPARRYEANLLLATWTLRKFGAPHGSIPASHKESLFYMAQVISSFDLVALQEVDLDLQRLRLLLDILGPDWDVLVNEPAPGALGNRERFAMLYYKPRVDFRNFSGQVILPPERNANGGIVPAQQFARPPLLAAFRAGEYEFQVCTAHIIYGGLSKDEVTERLGEVRKLGKYLKLRSKYEKADMFLLGDFQMGTRESPILDALREGGVEIPDEVLLPTNFRKDRYYDLIGYTSPGQNPFPLGTSYPRTGVFDLYEDVFQDSEYGQYLNDRAYKKYLHGAQGAPGEDASTDQYMRRRFWNWKTFLVSDHLPLWAELNIEDAGGGKA